MARRYFWSQFDGREGHPELSVDKDAKNTVDDPNGSLDVPPCDGEWLVRIEGTSDEVIREKGATPFHRVEVVFSMNPGFGDGRHGLRKFTKTFDLNTASGVGEARRFFALFDFPLTRRGEVSRACKRASQGFCRVRVSRKGRDRAHVEVVELTREIARDSTEDVWNHERHWSPWDLYLGNVWE